MEGLLLGCRAPRSLQYHLSSRRCRGVLRGPGHVAIVDADDGEHLSAEYAGACFGEWSECAWAAPEDGPRVELLLMPEEVGW